MTDAIKLLEIDGSFEYFQFITYISYLELYKITFHLTRSNIHTVQSVFIFEFGKPELSIFSTCARGEQL